MRKILYIIPILGIFIIYGFLTITRIVLLQIIIFTHCQMRGLRLSGKLDEIVVAIVSATRAAV